MVYRNMDRYRVLLSRMAIRREVDHMFSARQIARRQDQAIRRRRRKSERGSPAMRTMNACQPVPEHASQERATIEMRSRTMRGVRP